MKRKSVQWSMPVLAVLAIIAVASMGFAAVASGAEQPAQPDDRWIAQMDGEMPFQLPTPVLNPEKMTPTPGAASPPGAPTPGAALPTSAPVEEPDDSIITCSPIAYGETVAGVITNTEYGLGYCFNGTAGEIVDISVVVTSGNLGAYVGLFDPNDELLITNDPDFTEAAPPFISGYSLPDTGEYFIYMTRYSLEEGTSTGSFALTLNLGTGGTSGPAGTFVGTDGVDVTCDTGTNITDGAEIVVVQMRTGFSYTATVLGINGFDPVLAALGEDRTGLCNDDSADAATYSANLPTTGIVPAAGTNSQLFFSNSSRNAFADISLVVGGFNGMGGEFLLILEGMAVTSADNAGDPFSVLLTPNIVSSGVPVTVYMIAETNSLDPLMSAIDADYNYLVGDDGQNIICDDAGTNLCWGSSSSLSGYSVTRRGRALPGGPADSMINIDMSSAYDLGFSAVNYLMSSYQQRTGGDYIVVFHIGITGAQ
ncbi:MAG: hypothetical protein HC915_10655 [Anaerolineae bacterium]|nr:hypothetical protein [Anaerolineae bacterium]